MQKIVKATIAVGNRRLLKLAKLLRALPRKRFDYTHWVGDDWAGAKDLSCGTSACALGWAATMPALRRLGLRLEKNSYWWAAGVYLGKGHRTRGTFAAEKVFGLDYMDSNHLFVPEFDEDRATPKQVAKKIEKFVRDRSV